MSDDSVPTTISTSDGEQLEAEVAVPPQAFAGVVITHPHPTYGGSMYTPVPAALFAKAAELGMAAVRFNFRGVGRSTGLHDEGRGERLDVAAAVAHLRAQLPQGPIFLAGWSFGADVALAVAGDDVAGWLCVAAPLAVVPVEEMAAPDADEPKLLLVPEHDQFRTPEDARTATASWRNTRVEVVPSTDHFLAGGLGAVGDALARFVEDHRGPRFAVCSVTSPP